MEVILLQKVVNLGSIGDKVKVKPGYGRNYLLPQGKAPSPTRPTSRSSRSAVPSSRSSRPTRWRAPGCVPGSSRTSACR